MRVAGYLHGRSRSRVDHDSGVRRLSGLPCDNPLAALCEDCDHTEVWTCQGHRESRCKPCSQRYKRRVRRVAESGLDRRSGKGFMGLLTLTAPGDPGHRQWSLKGPRGDRPVCSCGSEHLDEWNASHSRRWNHFRTLLAREYPGLKFIRGVEVQDGRRGGRGRGALHDHAIIWTPDDVDLAVIQALALRAGFGCVIHYAPCEPGSRRAAYYIAKYVTKACDSRDLVPWLKVDPSTGEILSDRATYRTWSMSRDWGLTMREVRQLVADQAARTAAVRLEGTLSLLRLALGAEPLNGAPPGPPLL